MRISLRWLARHVDFAGLTADEVARAFTLHTAEVEGVEEFAPALGNVVVGHVLERSKHPDADKLSLCRVDVGSATPGGAPLQIVCGAPNVAAGQKVAVAREGTLLPGDLRIKRSKIRGQESAGMICSERELGLGEEHDGIWVLPADAPLGEPVADALGLRDWIVTIDNKSLTHRPDLWGHRGLARELAAIFGRTLKPLAPVLPRAQGAAWPVEIEDASCTRYVALCIDGVRAQRSPDWMRHLLFAAGQRPIDLLVDLSNFVMLDIGQPSHAFDRDALGEAPIRVRRARPGEALRTLDGAERKLEARDLLICSGERAVALAGVMGGEETKVGAQTQRVLLECASFHSAAVRRSAQAHALRSESSTRFEKSLSPTLPPLAAAHYFDLLRSIQPEVSLARAPSDVGTWTDPARSIALRPERARALLGLSASELPDERIAALLDALELRVTRAAAPQPWSVAIPSERATKDLTIERDLIEEIGRSLGYGNIPERAIEVPLAPAPRDERRALERTLVDHLAGAARFREAMTYSFLPEPLARALGLADERYVEVLNPVAEGWQRVRRGLVPSLLGLLAHNLRERSEVSLFELGCGYLPEHASPRGEPRELRELALVHARATTSEAASSSAPSSGLRRGALAHVQGVVESLLELCGRPVARWELADGQAPIAWSYAQPCLMALGAAREGEEPRVLASLGALDARRARELGLEAEVAFASLWIRELHAQPARPRVFRALPRYPSVKVDVALALPSALRASEAEAAIARAGQKLVERVELFDLFRGGALGEGTKSLAWHVHLRAADRTLAEKDTQRFLDRLAREAEALGGELRREAREPRTL